MIMWRELYQVLSKRDMAYLLDLSFSSLECTDQNNLTTIMQEFNTLFPVETILCASGNIDSMSKDKPVVKIIDISAPIGYVDMYFENKFHKTDAAIWGFLATLEPVSWLKLKCENYFSYPVSVMATEYSMNDGWCHGVLDIATMDLYIFWFGNSNRSDD